MFVVYIYVARGCRQMVDPVWEHGEKVGNGWKCKYCHEQRNGGGATRLKEHLAQRGKDAKDCPSVPHCRYPATGVPTPTVPRLA